MDPRHREILEAVVQLRDQGRTTVRPTAVAVKLGLHDPAALGVFFDEVCALGWMRPAAKGFTGDTDFAVTPEGERELNAARERPEPPATIEELEPQLRAFLESWAYDQPFRAQHLRQWLGLASWSNDDLRLLLAQMRVRGLIRPHNGSWYPA
jgi:hypothetical protein